MGILFRFRSINQLRTGLLHQNRLTFADVTNFYIWTFVSAQALAEGIVSCALFLSLPNIFVDCQHGSHKHLSFSSFPPGTGTSVLAGNLEMPPTLTALQSAPKSWESTWSDSDSPPEPADEPRCESVLRPCTLLAKYPGKCCMDIKLLLMLDFFLFTPFRKIAASATAAPCLRLECMLSPSSIAVERKKGQSSASAHLHKETPFYCHGNSSTRSESHSFWTRPYSYSGL